MKSFRSILLVALQVVACIGSSPPTATCGPGTYLDENNICIPGESPFEDQTIVSHADGITVQAPSDKDVYLRIGRDTKVAASELAQLMADSENFLIKRDLDTIECATDAEVKTALDEKLAVLTSATPAVTKEEVTGIVGDISAKVTAALDALDVPGLLTNQTAFLLESGLTEDEVSNLIDTQTEALKLSNKMLIDDAVAAQTEVLKQFIADLLAESLDEIACDTVDGTSCQNVLNRFPSSTSGTYRIQPASAAAPFEVFCRMDEGVGYTLVARVVNGEASWTYGEGDDAGTSSPWKTDTLFGAASATTKDYKGQSYMDVKGTRLMIESNNVRVVETADDCLQGKSLHSHFASLSWSCGGGEVLVRDGRPSDCAHACSVSQRPTAYDDILNPAWSPADFVFFQAGEKNGAQEANEDRAMISGSGNRNNVDAPVGLGSYCTGSCNGQANSNNVATVHDGSVAASGDLVYDIYVVDTREISGIPSSCQQVLRTNPKSEDGVYLVRTTSSSPSFYVYCKFIGNIAYTMISRVTSTGSRWQFPEVSILADLNNAWESDNHFGYISGSSDFKSFAYSQVAATRLMIQYQGNTLVQTTDNCFSGPFVSKLQSVGWECPASQVLDQYEPHPCAHACSVAPLSYATSDTVISSSAARANYIYFQAGEADGTQETNEDRAYVSGSGIRNHVDYPVGLGSYCTGTCSDGKIGSNNIGIKHDGTFAITGNHVYELFVANTAEVFNLPSSCSQVLSSNPNAVNGVFLLKPDASTPSFYAECKFESGKAYTLVARVTAGGNAWTYGESDNGNAQSPWEDDSTFGTISAAVDYKGLPYKYATGSKIMMQYNGAKLLETEGCHGDTSMETKFKGLSWSCAGGQSVSNSAPPACAHACRIVQQSYPIRDSLINPDGTQYLMLQMGEMNGAQETNEDRSYISGSLSRTNVDYAEGLGAYCTGENCGGGTAVGSVNIGQHHDGAVAMTGTHNYEIFLFND